MNKPLEPQFTQLVDGRKHHPSAVENLRRAVSPGIRTIIYCHAGRHDLAARVASTFEAVIDLAKLGSIGDCADVGALVRARIIGYAKDTALTPAEQAAAEVDHAFVEAVLKTMPAEEREMLKRFYVHVQGRDQIRREMQLTARKFRAVKTWAMGRFDGVKWAA